MSTHIINPKPQDFKWGSDKAANLKEPILALKEKGWQFADIPTASNFNWLISELAKWDKYLDGRINGTSDDIFALAVSINKQTKELRRDLRITVGVLEALLNKVFEHHPHPLLPLLPKLPDIREP